MLKLQCRRKLEDKRTEWARRQPITEHEACDEEDYDVEYFLPGSRDSDDLSAQEMVISTGWTPSNSDAGETLENANEEVNNNNSCRIGFFLLLLFLWDAWLDSFSPLNSSERSYIISVKKHKTANVNELTHGHVG